jgi:signal transduction histidine kinase
MPATSPSPTRTRREPLTISRRATGLIRESCRSTSQLGCLPADVVVMEAVRRLVRRRAIALLTVLVAVVGLAASVAAAVTLHRAGQQHVRDLLEQRAHAVHDAVLVRIQRYVDTVTDLAASAGGHDQLTVENFTAMTAGLDRQRLPGVGAVMFVVAAERAGIPAVQQRWRAAGNPALTLAPTAVAEEHRFVVLSRGLDHTGMTVGLDLAEAPEPVEAMDIARRSGRVTASRPYVLLRDRALPAEQRQMSFILAAPVSANGAAADAGAFRGWVYMSVRGRDFLDETLRAQAQGAAHASLHAAGADGAHVLLAQWGRSGTGPDAYRVLALEVAQRRWRLSVQPTETIVSGREAHLYLAALGVGLALTVMLTVLVASLGTSRDRALRRVRVATAELHADIARREEAETRLRQREVELAGFAAVAAHDLKAPLATIGGYAGLLDDELGDVGAGPREFVDQISQGVARMTRLIDDLLAYASADEATPRLQPVHLDRVVAEVVAERTAHLVAERPSIDVGPLPVVAADPLLVRQVLDNLLGNALKYVRHGTIPRISVSARPHPSGWRVEVADNGIGVPDDERLVLFGAFQRLRGAEGYAGTGLGLAICERIVTRHGGTIGVDANPGGGSRFWFTLPAADEDARRGAPDGARPSGG